MSSGLCKKPKGSVSPLLVEPVKDRKNNSIHAVYIDEANHRTCPATDLYKAAFDDIRRPELLPKMLGEAEKRKQLGQILSQLPNLPRIIMLPSPFESCERGLGL